MCIHKHTSFEQKGLRGKMQTWTEDLSEEKKSRYLLKGPEQAAEVEWECRVGRRVGPLVYNVERELISVNLERIH